MATAGRLFLLFVAISLVPAALPATLPGARRPRQTILDAAEALSVSGHNSMSLTVKSLASTLSVPLTIFAPSDAAFKTLAQPSLDHLLLHFSPLSLSPTFLLSLPFSYKIPTLSTAHYLTITTPSNSSLFIISINNVTMPPPPIFNFGSVVIYRIEAFFPLNFSNPPEAGDEDDEYSQCLQLEKRSMFQDASKVLKSRGYSIMASFLDLQVLGFISGVGDGTELTVFTPMDEELDQFSGNFVVYPSLLMRHLVPCKLGFKQLDEMPNGTVLPENGEGFNLNVTRNEDKLLVNKVQIIFPGMYESDRLAIHGIDGLINYKA